MSTQCSKSKVKKRSGRIRMHRYIGAHESHTPKNFVRWINCDSKERFEDEIKKPDADLSILDDSWGYHFNSYGYRGEEPDHDADTVIAVVGCSYTFGEGLQYDDTWANRFKELYQEAYPDERVNLLNLAQGGAANNYIARTVAMQGPLIKPDLLIAQFTYIERREFYEYEHLFSLGSWSENEHAVAFYSFYTDIAGMLNVLREMLQVQYFCKANDIDYIFTFAEMPKLLDNELADHPQVRPLLAQLDKDHFTMDYIEGYQVKCDHARDRMHPGRESNRNFAGKLFKFYQNMRQENVMDTLSSSANKEVLDFYRSLPFNYYSDPDLNAKQIKAQDAVQNYSVIIPYLKEGMRIADMGCGAGWLVNSLNYHHGASAVGIDFNQVAVDQADKVSGILECKSEFVVSDLFQYVPEEKFDFVTSVGVLHHTNACIDGVRHICRNVVADDGYVFIGLYHTYGRRPFLDHFEKMKEEGATEEALFNEYKSLYPAQTDETHLRSWFRDQVIHPHETQHTYEELAGVLEEEGLKVISTSINRFEEIEDQAELFEMEKEYYEIGLQRLEEKKYFPGFYVVLAKKEN